MCYPPILQVRCLRDISRTLLPQSEVPQVCLTTKTASKPRGSCSWLYLPPLLSYKEWVWEGRVEVLEAECGALPDGEGSVLRPLEGGIREPARRG